MADGKLEELKYKAMAGLRRRSPTEGGVPAEIDRRQARTAGSASPTTTG